MVQAYAPGRVELLGNHTDYNEGVVLGAAIERGLTISGTARADDRISLTSATAGRIEIALSDLQPQDGDKRWANYVLGVADELVRYGIPISGFYATIDGDLPAESGLSSSAALEVASALFLLKLTQRDLPRLEIAKLCQAAEHQFTGVQSGLLDQISCLFARADHVVFFDARTEEVRLVPFPKNLALMIAQSGTKRELSAGKYNERREETRAAARALGARALRDISSAQLDAAANLAPTLRRRAQHIVSENECVWAAVKLLERGNGDGLGQLMNESHESSRRNFENSTPELDTLVELARRIPGVLGARLTGAGFGGAIVTLCEKERAPEIARQLRNDYAAPGGRATDIFVTGAAASAR